MDNKLQIKCTTKDENEKKHIQDVFKKHHVSMAGFVLEMLREKVLKMEKEG